MLREHQIARLTWTNAVISVYQQLGETPKDGPGGQGVAVQAPSAEISGELSRPHLARPMSSAARGSLIAMPSYNLVIALPTADRSSAYAFAQALGLETPGELAEEGYPNRCGCSSTSRPL
jgi:hypothetical protein